MKQAVRPIAFSAAFVLATALVPGGAAFAQGGMWRPDPAMGPIPVVDAAAFRPGVNRFQPRSGLAMAAPRYRTADGDRVTGRGALSAPAPNWRSVSRYSGPAERPAPAPWYRRAPAPMPMMPAALPWSAPLPPAAPAHAGYAAAYAVPPMPAWGAMPQWQPALAYHGYTQLQRPAAYRPAPVQAPARWNGPSPAAMEPRPVPGAWRPDPLAASIGMARYRLQASAYTSPRHPVFRGAALAGRQPVQARLPVPPVAGHWRPDTAVAWASSQAFRPVAYGRSIARAEQPVQAAAEETQRSPGDLPGWATTLDRLEQTGICAWCSSGT